MSNEASALVLLAILMLSGASIIGCQKHSGAFGWAGYLTTGMSVVILVFHGLGALSILSPTSLLGCLVVASLIGLVRSWPVCVRALHRVPPVPKNRFSRFELATTGALAAVLVILVSALVRWNLGESAGYDALAYHMYSPLRALWWTNSLDGRDLAPNAGLPLGAGSIHGLFVLLGGDPRASTANLVIILLLLLGSFRAVAGVRAGLTSSIVVTIILLLAGPLVFGQLSSDTLLAAFVPTILRRGHALTNRRTTFAMGDGVILSSLPLVKPFGLIPLTLICAFVFLQVRNVRVLWLSFAVLTPTFGWWLKNFLQVSNPFYPMFNNLLKPKFVDPEALSLEDDVRSSFRQFLDFFQNHFDWNLTSGSNDNGFFFFVILALGGLLVIGVTWTRLSPTDKGVILVAVVSSVAIVSITGPVFRYLLFAWVMLAVLFVKHLMNTSKESLGGRGRRYGIFALIVALAVMLVPHGLRGNGLIKMYQGRENTGRIAEAAIALQGAVVDTDVVCIFGEGRLLQFWPNRTEFLPPDLRNPFTTKNELSSRSVKDQLRKSKCDYLLLFEGWGAPRNLNGGTLKTWKNQESAIDLVRDGGWLLYRL